MKRVVFLCLLAMMSLTSASAASTTVYGFDTYDMKLTLIRNESNHLGYELEKVGQEPFSREFMVEGGDLHIVNVAEIDGFHVFMGNVLRNEETRHYNGFVQIMNTAGDDIHTMEFSYGDNEDVREVYVMNDVIMFMVRVAEYNDQEQYDFKRYTFELFDYQFQSITQTEVYQEQDHFLASREMLLMDQDGDDRFDQAILQSGELINADVGLPIEPHQVFEEETYIPFVNEAYVNGDTYVNGIYIDFPGKYSMVYQDSTYQFQVDATISGVEDGGIYNKGVTPYISNGQIFLNNDLYVSGTPISTPGEYTLSVLGVGDYQKDVSFQITSAIDGVYDNQTYATPVSFTFNGRGYLNNTFITSPYNVSEPGDYVLKIEGENNYQETYEFTIETEEERHTFVDFLKQYDLIILGVTVVSGLLILKKK